MIYWILFEAFRIELAGPILFGNLFKIMQEFVPTTVDLKIKRDGSVFFSLYIVNI